MTSRDWLVLLLLVVVGITLRAAELDYPALDVDEAESSINALTILDHGYPTDRYLDQPIYENTLIEPWTEHPEYEFRDLSYANGVAVYHGWLPLYAMAGSLAAFGIEPDAPPEPLRVQHGRDQLRIRTIAPRVPSVLFSVLFLVAFFALGNKLYGRDAAWSALLAASLISGLISHGSFARYYSATYALVTLGGLAIWCYIHDRRWRNLAWVAIVLVLLFYTHVLSFSILCCLLGVFSLRWSMTRVGVRQMLGLAALLLLGTLPWALLTGFIPAALKIPKAWALVELPLELGLLPLRKPAFVIPALLALVWIVATQAVRRPLPPRFTAPFRDHRRAFFFLATWSALGFGLFLLLIPAASYFPSRPYIVTVVPGLMLFAFVVAGISRALSPRFSGALSVLLMGLTLYATGESHFQKHRTFWTYNAPIDLVEVLRRWEIPSGARLYSTPNDHLVLSYYTGLPIQSIAPIRKSFLDAFEGPIFFIDAKSGARFLSVDQVLEIAAEHGVELSADQARRMLDKLNVTLVADAVSKKTAAHWPPPRDLSPLERSIAAEQAEAMRVEYTEGKQSPALFRGYEVRDPSDWWALFFYRFAGVESRWRNRLNYAERMQSASALILPWGWTLYESTPGDSALVLTPAARKEAFETAIALGRSDTGRRRHTGAR